MGSGVSNAAKASSLLEDLRHRSRQVCYRSHRGPRPVHLAPLLLVIEVDRHRLNGRPGQTSGRLFHATPLRNTRQRPAQRCDEISALVG